MFRRRFSHRSFRPQGNSGNFSRFVSDATALAQQLNDQEVYRQVVIAPSNIAGIRRCRNFELNMDPIGGQIFWALLFVPQGINAAQVDIAFIQNPQAPVSLYSPEQHIMASDVCAPGAPSHSFTKTSRSLADGDQVILVLRAVGASTVSWRLAFNIAFA
jgi:hypothetical protein